MRGGRSEKWEGVRIGKERVGGVMIGMGEKWEGVRSKRCERWEENRSRRERICYLSLVPRLLVPAHREPGYEANVTCSP